MLFTLLFYAAVLFGLYALWRKQYRGAHYSDSFLKRKIVFISGCDSGFGEQLSLSLYKRGFRVYSGCLTDKGIHTLTTTTAHFSGGGELHAFKCDVTKDEDVINAHKIIADVCKETGEGVWAIVNNAGIAAGGPVEWCPVSSYQKVMDVNFMGHVRVTKAFLPLIRKGNGRVINVTSMAGYLAIPHMSAYCAAKHALEAFNSSLRREMAYFGIYIVDIAPGFMKTPIIAVNDLFKQNWDNLSDEVKSDYRVEYRDMMKDVMDNNRAIAEPPELVIDAMVEAVTLVHPPPKFNVGKIATRFYYIASLIPTIWLDFIFTKNIRTLKNKVRK